jgi:acyl-CoA thioester hydrolase
VYYARYLDFLEAARGEFFRHLGKTLLQWQGQDVIFPVIESHLRYKAPARYDDLLAIDISVVLAARVRLNFAYIVSIEDKMRVLEGETFHVCSGIDEKPKALPEELLRSLGPYVKAAPLTPYNLEE